MPTNAGKDWSLEATIIVQALRVAGLHGRGNWPMLARIFQRTEAAIGKKIRNLYFEDCEYTHRPVKGLSNTAACDKEAIKIFYEDPLRFYQIATNCLGQVLFSPSSFCSAKMRKIPPKMPNWE